uniref:Tyrosyl-DNA phosphodiesterase 2 n=1 Tax=Sarcophilus harrisii TaxID=9305 RepID=A0A7N4PTN6_SARHA
MPGQIKGFPSATRVFRLCPQAAAPAFRSVPPGLPGSGQNLSPSSCHPRLHLPAPPGGRPVPFLQGRGRRWRRREALRFPSRAVSATQRACAEGAEEEAAPPAGSRRPGATREPAGRPRYGDGGRGGAGGSGGARGPGAPAPVRRVRRDYGPRVRLGPVVPGGERLADGKGAQLLLRIGWGRGGAGRQAEDARPRRGGLVTICGNELCLLNSHFESTRNHARERMNQLKMVLKKMQEVPESITVIFGGDTNLRDHEVSKSGGLPEKILDVWEFLGKPEHCRYTWDTQANTNLAIEATCKLRFDRIFFRPAADGCNIVPRSLDLLGLEKLDCGRFPSDHWGLLCGFDVIL